MIPIIAVVAVLGLIGGARLTNPFSRITIVRQTFIVQTLIGSFQAINRNHKLRVRQAPWWKLFVNLKSAVHILENRWGRSPRASATTVDGIIAEIHASRFNPKKLLLISGDQWSPLFVRNMGVFYYPTLDPCVPSNETDWHNRQVSYLQTLAYALGVFEKHRVPATTIVATGAYAATCINYYVYPSDSIYSLLYALAALLGKESAMPTRQPYTKPRHNLETQAAARVLFDEYRPTLLQLYEHYRAHVFDERSGMLQRTVRLSGAKDITRRECAFYDNVVFWKATQLAMTLGLTTEDRAFLTALKRKIIKTFWLEKEGYFLEELSAPSQQGKFYSSDWLIVLVTGFLDPAKKSERVYFERSVDYIQTMGVDKPFAIKYQHASRPSRQHFWPRIAFPSYGGDSIWSFWGMEYIKVLLLLNQMTGRKVYLKTADEHLKKYEQVMLRDGGFPEMFSRAGKLYESPLYRSIRQTGWVIGFEQARAMRAAIKRPKG